MKESSPVQAIPKLIANRITVETIFSRGPRQCPSVFLKKMRARFRLSKNKKI
jgi:hypothetical protein